MTRLSATAAALLVLAACAGAPPTDKPEITALDITGNQALTDKQIKARIVTAAESWVPFSDKQYLDEAALQTDLKRILRLYQARGYYDARIKEFRVTPSDDKEVKVEIEIDEGQPVKIADLAIEGLNDLPPGEVHLFEDALPLAEGQVLQEDLYTREKEVLAQRLTEAGFAEAEVNGVVEVDRPKHEATVVFNVDHGIRYRFGEIFIAGANRIPRKKLIEVARDAVPEGQIYSESALNLAQGKIFDLGVFSAVKVTRGAPDRQQKTIPVVVNVREAPFRTLRIGGGVGLDPTRQEIPHALTEWTSRNFYGGLRRFSVNGKLALVFLPGIISAWGDPTHRGVAGSIGTTFQQPEAFLRDLTFDSAIDYEHGVEQAYRFDSARGRLGFVYRIGRDLTLAPSLNYNLFKLAGTVESALESTNRSQEALLDECAATGRLCLLSYLEERLSFDQRDNAVEPTRGFQVSLSLQEGSHLLGGDYDYFRFLPEIRGYIPLGVHVLALRGAVGALVPASDQSSSVLTRFFLGGSTSERGYGTRNLAPRVVVATDTKPGQNAEELPIGGNGMLQANAELRLSLPANFGLVFFVDTGEVTPFASEVALSGLQVATGFGLRYRTVFGPARLDLAWRVIEQPLARFTITGEVYDPATNPLQPPSDLPPKVFGIQLPIFHISIGEAF